VFVLLAMVKMGKTMAKSTQIMSAMNNLVRLPQLRQVMMAMAKEMSKAELIEDMMSDTLDQDVDEDEADETLDKVLF
jgi:charged multivesicular body protein 3